MVDFNKLREDAKARLANLPVSTFRDAPKPEDKNRDIAEDRAMLGDLLGCHGALNAWEIGFCESCLNRILKYQRGLTEPQGKVLDKTWAKHMDSDKTSDPTPKGNPAPQKYLKPLDDPSFNDDDIPF